MSYNGRWSWWLPCGSAVLAMAGGIWVAGASGASPCAGKRPVAKDAVVAPVTSASTARAENVALVTGEPAAPDAAVYTVSLKSDALGHSWTGTEKISFANPGKVPITEFWIRLWGNGDAGCGGTPPERISDLVGGRIAQTSQNCTAFRIVLDSALKPGTRGEVSFGLAIDAPQRRDRFGVNGVDTYLGNVIAVLAVKDENGWELPPYIDFGESFYSLTADFDVTLDHPASLQVPATGTVVGETAIGDRLVTHIAAPKVRDFAWSAGPFNHASVVSSTGVKVEAYWQDSEGDIRCRGLMQYAANALDSYAARFGAYPYSRFTIVFDEFGAAFDGMEYPNYVLSSAHEGTVAHEVAHQWWYALVGDDQYRHPWLDEAFAEYSAEEFQGSIVPAHNCDWIAPDERMDATMDVYTKAGDHLYHDAIYHEGTCMLFDLEHTIGHDAMDKLLRGLVQKYGYGVERPADVRALAQSVSGQDLSGFWVRWRNIGD